MLTHQVLLDAAINTDKMVLNTSNLSSAEEKNNVRPSPEQKENWSPLFVNSIGRQTSEIKEEKNNAAISTKKSVAWSDQLTEVQIFRKNSSIDPY